MSRRTRSTATLKKVLGSTERAPARKTSARSTPAVTPVALPSVASEATATTEFFPDEATWQAWLESNLDHTPGLWLKISKKGAANPSVSYDAALDIALCFGWIDGQTKSLDDGYFLRKFTPRRKNSLWSKRNVDKIAVLEAAGRIRPSGQAEVDAAQADGRWARAYASPSNCQVPEDFQKALDKNKKAKAFFDALNKGKRYSFIWRIETTKRAETRQRKITQFVELLSEYKTL
ncbi:hypothetical protein GQ53DRAFT_20933 [Thozetella sp. PMI_491]|nr:hypothetical protein GQ53DRAFT_20933 [Thozetella sp. PMI_491]